jgi:multiple sugar transport system permease protein
MRRNRQKVAEVANLPSGRVQVVGLSPATVNNETFADRKFDAGRDELTKIRQVDPRWENYPEALAYLPADTLRGLRFLGNTLTITILTVIGTLLSRRWSPTRSRGCVGRARTCCSSYCSPR